MSRCEGSTKAGQRCKRSARGGSRFCSAHAGPETKTAKETATGSTRDSGRTGTDSGRSGESECVERDVFDAMFGLAAAGVVIVAALTLRRLIRIF